MRATLNYNGNARTMIFLRPLSRGENQHFDEDQVCPAEWNSTFLPRRRVSTYPTRPPFSSIFLDRFPSVNLVSMISAPRIDRVINEIRLIYVDGTSRRIDRAKLRIIEVRVRNCVETRPHPSRVIPRVENFPINSRCSPRSREGGM